MTSHPKDNRAALAKLTLVVGKGGVGKTTVAAATATYAASQTRPVCLVSTDPAHSLADLLGADIGVEPTEIVPWVWAVQIDPARSFAVFLDAVRAPLRMALDRGTYLDDADIQALVELPLPGIDEVTALLEMSKLVNDPRWPHIIVDTAPTGHTERLLGLPAQFRAYLDVLDDLQQRYRYMVARLGHGIHPGLLDDPVETFLSRQREEIEAFQTLLHDGGRTAIEVVAIGEEIVVDETLRYLGWLVDRHLPVVAVVLNRVARHAATRRVAVLQQSMERLRNDHPGLRVVQVPEFRKPPMGTRRLRCVGALLASGAWRASPEAAPQVASDRPPAWHAEQPRFPLLDLPLQFFVGKGGVGKTTLASTNALALARSLQPILLVSLDPAHSLSDVFGVSIGDQPLEVAPGLWALEVDAEKRWEQLRTGWQDALVQALDDAGGTRLPGWHDMVSDLDRVLSLMPPGVDEVVGLFVLGEVVEAGIYRAIVVDCAPTGHLLRLLALPELVLEWVHLCMRLVLKYKNVVDFGRLGESLLNLAREVREVAALLRDPERCGTVAVVNVEPPVIEETDRLLGSIMGQGMPVSLLVNNRATRRIAEADPDLHQEDNVSRLAARYNMRVVHVAADDQRLLGMGGDGRPR